MSTQVKPRIMLPVLHASDQSPVDEAHPIVNGEWIEVYCAADKDLVYPMDWRENGFKWPPFHFLGNLAAAIFSGVRAWINYCGPAPGFPNLVQVNVYIPPGGPPESGSLPHAVPGAVHNLHIFAGVLASEPQVLPVGPGGSWPRPYGGPPR